MFSNDFSNSSSFPGRWKFGFSEFETVQDRGSIDSGNFGASSCTVFSTVLRGF